MKEQRGRWGENRRLEMLPEGAGKQGGGEASSCWAPDAAECVLTLIASRETDSGFKNPLERI